MEIWKDVKGFEGLYQVSNLGRVKSYDFYRNGNKLYKGKILKGHINNVGYLCFDLYKDKKRKNLKCHRLVAENFIECEDKELWINHKDGNKLNNHFSNLEWVTPKENSIHAFDRRLIVKKGKIVIDLNTGIFYESIRQAYRHYSFNFSRSYFQNQLKGKIENKTDFKLV